MIKKILGCRRTVVALFGIACLTYLGAKTGIDISGISLAIAGIVTAVAGANSYENVGKAKVQGPDQPQA
jgi:hypothetical protein